jgi:hypothetical protein
VSRNFDKGEPALVLTYEDNSLGIWTVVIFVLLAGTSVFVWKLRKTLISDNKSHTDSILNPATTDFLEDGELIEAKMNDDVKIIKIKKGNIIRLVKEKLE